MSTPVRVSAFVVGLVVLFGVAFGVGRLFEDDDQAAASYSLRLTASQPRVDGPVAIRFSVIRDHDVLTRFETRHEKQLHLIAVREDFGGYRHLHPTMAADGTWTVASDLGAGRWRLFADFQPTGETAVVTHTDVTVDGTPAPAPARPPYQVDLAWTGSGAERQATFTISRDGRPVTDLEPYLGAFGHLVVLSDPGLAFQHVHPEAGPSGPTVAFRTGIEAAGSYRLYLEFQHGGTVHTVPFVASVTGAVGDHEEGDHGDH
jgi:hypothetical protein